MKFEINGKYIYIKPMWVKLIIIKFYSFNALHILFVFLCHIYWKFVSNIW